MEKRKRDPAGKIIVIVGPTAAGKSSLAVRLAKKFNGEAISADSRQVYRSLDIGTGKITRKEMRGVPHHLLDVASPRRAFTVAEYKGRAERAISGVTRHGKLPILCGGTGFYIQAVVDDLTLPDVPPDNKLRARLAKKSPAQLFTLLKKIDSRRAREIDRDNPRRLVRAIEIAKALGKVPLLEASLPRDRNALQIGIDMPNGELKKRIRKRLIVRMKKGMIAEAERLHKQGLSWKRMEELGLEYRYLARYLQKKITKKQMIEQLERETWHYAKRQRTWFKKDKRIKWFLPAEGKKIEETARKFLREGH